ncbi:MAG: hypothetical protein NW201_01685 [Gemmatimonadales bacterium]|nr:hypothetical protein [Gemmatimonadales bacterium]
MLTPPEIVDVPAVPAAVIEIVVARTEMPRVMRPAIAELLGVLQAQGLRPSGPRFAHHLEITHEAFHFELGFPVEGTVTPAGRVRPGMLPAARIGRAVYTGPYPGLHAAWEAFDDALTADGWTLAPQVWEEYLTGPEGGGDPSTFRTRFNRPVSR